MKQFLSVSAALCLLAIVTACGTENPAGGSNSLTAPRPVSPAMGASVKFVDQPLTLTVQNAVTTGKSALTYTFEVASDAAFAAIVAKKEKVTAGTDTTSVKLDANLAGGKGYYWRARAIDAGVDGPNSTSVNFSLGSAVDLQAPQPETPAINATVAGVRPTFVITNAGRSGPVGTIYYRFEIADSTAFSSLIAQGTVQEQGTPTGQTSWAPDVDLPTGKTLYWHVRTTDPSNNVSSSYSNTRSFTVSKTGDEIDASLVTWLSPACTDIGGWKITSQITDTYVDPNTICIYHTKSGQWPLADVFGMGVDNIEGNMLIVAKIDGHWYGGGIDWLGEGRTCKGMTAEEIGMDQVRVPPMDKSWPGPRAGDQVGLLVSTPSSDRIPIRTINERSNIKLVIWPY
jgi:hypothetical protein